jgi:purine-binding chemotaxis protein CheW
MAGVQIIMFDVCGVACALHRSAVRELLPLPRLWFGLELDQSRTETELYRHLILIENLGQAGLTALLVDRVLDVVTVDGRQLSPVPESGTLNGCVEAEITHDGRLSHLLSLERVLFAEEQQALTELAHNAQNRLSEWAVSA